jgi:hypothetical protein
MPNNNPKNPRDGSDGGLIISEATSISITGRGWLGAPGLYSDEQVEGWKKITLAVHAKGGHMFSQLWHTGRSSHVETTGGKTPVSASVNLSYWKDDSLGAHNRTADRSLYRHSSCERSMPSARQVIYVDTNVVLEAHRTGCLSDIMERFDVRTVEMVSPLAVGAGRLGSIVAGWKRG